MRAVIGEFLSCYEPLSETDRRALWLSRGGSPFDGPVGPVRRLARIEPRDGPALPFRIPFLFRLDGDGTYFGDDADGLWKIFGGRSRSTRLLWGKLLMRGRPEMRVAEVALGRTSLVSDLRGRERMLHEVVAWIRLPARLYLHWRRRRLGLDSYEVPAVRFLPPHGRYTVVPDPRRILWRGRYDSLETYRNAEREGTL